MMRAGDKRPMKDGRTFVMTTARQLGNRKAADKRRGVRFRPLKVHANAHPLVRQFVEILNRECITLTSVAARCGIDRCVMHRWRIRSNPSIAMFSAALNALGYELRIRPRWERDDND